MKEKESMLSREDLDEAFHNLQNTIHQIAVEEEEEMVRQEVEGKKQED